MEQEAGGVASVTVQTSCCDRARRLKMAGVDGRERRMLWGRREDSGRCSRKWEKMRRFHRVALS